MHIHTFPVPLKEETKKKKEALVVEVNNPKQTASSAQLICIIRPGTCVVPPTRQRKTFLSGRTYPVKNNIWRLRGGTPVDKRVTTEE